MPDEHGALARLDAAFGLFSVGIAATPELEAAIASHADRLTKTMAPWATGGNYLNFSETKTDTHSAFDAETYSRLQAVRAQVDPHGVLQANHEIA